MKKLAFLLLLACLLPAALPSGSEAQKKEEGSKQMSDEQFVLKASEDGLAEVNHGMLASQKAQNPAIKQFADRMVKDHGKANSELLGIANKKGFKVAMTMGKKHKAMQDKLAALSGEDFDRQYMDHMIEGHQKALSLFKSESKTGKDQELKAFAEKTVPTIEEHLSLARQIHGKASK